MIAQREKGKINGLLEGKVKRTKVLFSLVLVLILIFYFGCSEEGSIMDEVKPVVYGKVTDTFTGEPIEGVEVKVVDAEGSEYATKTDKEGKYRIELSEIVSAIIMVNFDEGKPNYIPSMVTKDGEYDENSVSNYIPINEENFEVNIDIVKKYEIFWRSVLDLIIEQRREYGEDIGEDEAIKSILDAYRGRDLPSLNQVWVRQPEKFIVYDPHGYLRDYEDERRNPIFDNIMEGFKAIEEYTSGVIKAPNRDDVEIRESGGDTDYAIYFEITDGRAFEGESVNDYNEIVRSGAGTSAIYGTAGELIASVQGGDNESALDTVFDGNPMNDYDRLWGKYNYKKREPGSRFYPVYTTSFDEPHYRKTDNPFGFLFETRDYDEVQRVKEN